MIKPIAISILSFLCFAHLLADEPFRNHRYDSFQATPVTKQSIVFVGNSITNMQPWAELFTVPNVVNRGNSGAFSWEILANVQSYIACRPEKLFIMVGTNDMNVDGYAPENVVKNVRQTVKHIQKESPLTKVFVESVMPSTNGRRTVEKGRILNAQLRRMAEEMGVTFIDYFEALMGCSDMSFSYDNLHPHVLGTAKWTNVLSSYVSDSKSAVLTEIPLVNNAGRADSYGARTSVFGQLPVTKDDVLFIGDEFVHSGEWQELLGNPNVKNRGTGWGRWGPDLNYQTACVPVILKGLKDNVPPKQILLMIGTQNLSTKKTEAELETFKSDYDSCIAVIRKYAPKTKITLVSEIPYGVSLASLNTSNLVPINNWLKAKAESNDNMDYCDLFSVLTDVNNFPIPKYLNDNHYVTGMGYQACARELAKHIEGCNVMNEKEAEAYYNLLSARKALSNAVDELEWREDASITTTLEDAYSLLAKDNATVFELNRMISKISQRNICNAEKEVLELHPHEDLPKNVDVKDFTKVFLAGTIDMGKSIDWQAQVKASFASKAGKYLLYNPRQEHWDATKAGEMDYQVNWELEHLEQSDIVIMNFLPDSQSPITLLELGLFAHSNKLYVCCPKKFYRYDNVRITCERYRIPLYEDFSSMLKSVMP